MQFVLQSYKRFVVDILLVHYTRNAANQVQHDYYQRALYLLTCTVGKMCDCIMFIPNIRLISEKLRKEKEKRRKK